MRAMVGTIIYGVLALLILLVVIQYLLIRHDSR